MKSKRGKTSVMSFRIDRNLEELIDTSGLNIASLVEQGLISQCMTPGQKSEMIMNGIIHLIDLQIVALEERKEAILKHKSELSAPRQTTSPQEPGTAPAADYDSGERLPVIDIKTHKTDLVSRAFYEQNKDRLKITAETWDD